MDEAARRAVVDAVVFGPRDLFPADSSATEARKIFGKLEQLERERAEIVSLKDDHFYTYTEAVESIRAY